MKKTFNWYFPLTEKEIKKIWRDGVLIVDTNVLLDLYRYHQNTTKALLDSLNGFSKRAWLPYQVADEFFRNRNGVILSSTSTFNDAERNLLEMRKSIEEHLKKLRSNRIIPDQIDKSLENAINKAISEAEKNISIIKSKHPNYTMNDAILDSIVNLFDSSIGPPNNKEVHAEVLKEAKRRMDNKIPPGFKDSGKDGDKKYGDYIIWRQTIDYIKEIQKPLIFVTSDQKDDWYERYSGKTVGPLYELLKEFHEETGQKFLLYRTERFLEFANKYTGKQTNSEAIAEILDVANQRTSPLVKIISHSKVISETDAADGILLVELLEPSKNFSCSGRFEPELSGVPILQATLVNFPPGTPEYVIRSGTGTTFDFNIHLKSANREELLPVGKYIFEYNAKINKLNS